MKVHTTILAILVALSLWTESAIADSYYVDSVQGSDGDTGTSPQEAWKTLEKVNSAVYEPGDRILFKAGARYRGQLKPQGSGALMDGSTNAIVVDMYGEGAKPRIEAAGEHQAALYLYNVEYWEINNLRITNQGTQRKPSRYGVYVHIEDFGTANHIQLKNLDIHDVNGSLSKKEGGGSAIKYRNKGRRVRSRFDGLLIEGCHIVRCERNAITGSGYSNRREWYPNLNVVIRNNLIEQVPGDGIVPNACDGALVDHNIMQDCTRLLPEGEAAAGIWPWSCDNTVIQYNEVSDHKAPWDAQGFDSDWNCRNTLIQYNFSHDNEGGFLLICNNGGSKMPQNIGNVGTVVRYNISVNDGLRRQPTARRGMFSPTFHISGPCRDTQIYNNLIYITKKPGPKIDRTLLEMDNWGGPWPENTTFCNNIFYTQEQTSYEYGEATGTLFDSNLFFGTHQNRPEDQKAILADPMFVESDGHAPGRDGLRRYRLAPDSPCIGKGRRISESGGVDFFGGSLPKDRAPSIGPIEIPPDSRP